MDKKIYLYDGNKYESLDTTLSSWIVNLVYANTTEKVNAIIAEFNKPDSYGNFNALVQGFQPKFEAIVNEELMNFHSI